MFFSVVVTNSYIYYKQYYNHGTEVCVHEVFYTKITELVDNKNQTAKCEKK